MIPLFASLLFSTIIIREVFALQKKLFRDKFIDNLSSPEQFDAYIKIMNPKVWVMLIAMIIILLNTMAWTYFENQVIRIPSAGVAKDGKIVCYLKERDKPTFDLFGDDVYLYVFGVEETFDGFVSISAEPTEYSDKNAQYAAHLGKVYYGDWIYEVTFNADVPDGVYEVVMKNDYETR